MTTTCRLPQENMRRFRNRRIACVEEAFEQINATLQQLSARFDSLVKRINWLGFRFTTLVTLGAPINEALTEDQRAWGSRS